MTNYDDHEWLLTNFGQINRQPPYFSFLGQTNQKYCPFAYLLAFLIDMHCQNKEKKKRQHKSLSFLKSSNTYFSILLIPARIRKNFAVMKFSVLVSRRRWCRCRFEAAFAAAAVVDHSRRFVGGGGGGGGGCWGEEVPGHGDALRRGGARPQARPPARAVPPAIKLALM